MNSTRCPPPIDNFLFLIFHLYVVVDPVNALARIYFMKCFAISNKSFLFCFQWNYLAPQKAFIQMKDLPRVLDNKNISIKNCCWRDEQLIAFRFLHSLFSRLHIDNINNRKCSITLVAINVTSQIMIQAEQRMKIQTLNRVIFYT